MGVMTRKLRREQKKNKVIRQMAEQGRLAGEYISEAQIKLTKDVSTYTTGRVIAMNMMVMHKYWGWGAVRIKRFLSDLTKFAGDMVTEGITHDDIRQALIDECGVDVEESMKEAREENSVHIRKREEELVDLRTKRLIGGAKVG